MIYFLKFVWYNKSNENRNVTNLDYSMRGLRMIHLEHFIVVFKETGG